MDSESPAEIVAISSHVVRGSVGNRAIVFALETMGFRVWSLPTVILPWHPGHGPSTRITPPDSQFAAAVKDMGTSRWSGSVKAVVTGYFGSVDQLAPVARLVRKLKEANPGLIFVCDPVIGDSGGLYVKTEVAEAIRDHLIPIADVATPNRYELGWLCGAALETNNEIIEAALSLGPRRVLVTSAVPMMAGGIGNLLLTERLALLAEHRMVGNPPNGRPLPRPPDAWRQRGEGAADDDRFGLRDPRPLGQARSRRADAVRGLFEFSHPDGDGADPSAAPSLPCKTKIARKEEQWTLSRRICLMATATS